MRTMVISMDVFLWAGVNAKVENGKVIDIREREHLGQKYFKELSYTNGVLVFETKTGISGEYDFINKQFNKLSNLKIPLSLNDALKLRDLFDAFATIQANFDTIKDTRTRIQFFTPIDVPLILPEDLEDLGIKKIDEIANNINKLIELLPLSDYEPEVIVSIENLTNKDKEYKIEFDVPNDILIGYREKPQKWILLNNHKLKIKVNGEEIKTLNFIILSLKRGQTNGKIKIIHDDKIIDSKDLVIYAY